MLGAGDTAQAFDAALAAAADRRARIIASMASDRANRAGRPWTLTRPHDLYAGAYASDAWGRIEVAAEGRTLTIRHGALQAVAEPFTQPDSVRVELVLGRGEAIVFEGEGARPTQLHTRLGRFHRL